MIGPDPTRFRPFRFRAQKAAKPAIDAVYSAEHKADNDEHSYDRQPPAQYRHFVRSPGVA